MSGKNEQLYKAVLISIKGFLPNFNPSIAMCDFEKSSRNAFRSIFPNINQACRGDEKSHPYPYPYPCHFCVDIHGYPWICI